MACPDDDEVGGGQGVLKDRRAEHVVLDGLQTVARSQHAQVGGGVGIGQLSVLKRRWVRVLAWFLSHNNKSTDSIFHTCTYILAGMHTCKLKHTRTCTHTTDIANINTKSLFFIAKKVF